MQLRQVLHRHPHKLALYDYLQIFQLGHGSTYSQSFEFTLGTYFIKLRVKFEYFRLYKINYIWPFDSKILKIHSLRFSNLTGFLKNSALLTCLILSCSRSNAVIKITWILLSILPTLFASSIPDICGILISEITMS